MLNIYLTVYAFDLTDHYIFITKFHDNYIMNLSLKVKYKSSFYDFIEIKLQILQKNVILI